MTPSAHEQPTHGADGVVLVISVYSPDVGGAHGEVAQARESLAARWRLWAALRWAHRVVVLNPEMEADVLRLGVPPTKVVRSSCGVDAEAFAPVDADTRARLRQSFGLHPEHVVTAYCGRLAVQKELPTLLDAHARAGDRDATLVLVGDGPLLDALRAQATQRGVTDSVRFLGPLSRERVGALLQASDVFTLVSAAEGSPCALIEAMATALPCVVSDIAGNRDLVDDGVHGLRVAVRDVEGLAAALTRLRRDAKARQNMGANARARVLAQHTLDAVVARYEAVYREIRGGA